MFQYGVSTNWSGTKQTGTNWSPNAGTRAHGRAEWRQDADAPELSVCPIKRTTRETAVQHPADARSNPSPSRIFARNKETKLYHSERNLRVQSSQHHKSCFLSAASEKHRRVCRAGVNIKWIRRKLCNAPFPHPSVASVKTTTQ